MLVRKDIYQNGDERVRTIDLSHEHRPLVKKEVRFQVNLKQGNSAWVNKGSVRLHGLTTVTIEGQYINFAGLEAWIYVEYNRGQYTASIKQSWDEPSSDALVLRLPLVKVTSKGTGENLIWRIEEICHEGDFNFDMPLR